ncbi:J domain-containing protein [Candidatus Woesebacteria bacterium]|nr:J domain-containing protein [Candidatus Woesebacteria bacterium]
MFSGFDFDEIFRLMNGQGDFYNLFSHRLPNDRLIIPRSFFWLTAGLTQTYKEIKYGKGSGEWLVVRNPRFIKETEARAVLGLNVDASSNEVKSRFRSLAKDLHPDMPDGDSERFRQITEAYEVLQGRSGSGKPEQAMFKIQARLPDSVSVLRRDGVEGRWSPWPRDVYSNALFSLAKTLSVAPRNGENYSISYETQVINRYGVRLREDPVMEVVEIPFNGFWPKFEEAKSHIKLMNTGAKEAPFNPSNPERR